MPPAAAVDSVQTLLDQTASDPSTDPAVRVANLRALRDDIASLVGNADRYIADQELRREADGMSRVRDFVGARAAADARGGLLDEHGVSPKALDAAGVLSHDELDRRAADGTLEESILGLPLTAELQEMWSEAARARSIEVRREKARLRGESQLPSFASRTRELDTRVADTVARARGEAGAASPGTHVADTGPVPQLHAPANPAGKVSQKHLLALAKRATSQPSTVDVYAHTGADGKRVYDESRRALHQKIVEDALAGLPSQESPHVLFMGGGYASGKGTLRRRLASEGKVPEHALTLDPDEIKAQLPEFQHMAKEGDPEANLATYEEAWDIAQHLQREAMKRKVNMVVDGLSNTSPEDMLNRVKAFKDAGYGRAEAHYAHVPTDTAVKWAAARAAKPSRPASRRVIPETLMRATHRDVSAALPGIIEGSKGKGGLDALHIQDTSGDGEPKPLYSLQDGKETIHDKAGYQAALEKANESVAGVDAPARADTPVALEEIEQRGLNEWPKPGETAKRILGDARDTQELYRAKGAASPGTGTKAVYDAARKPVHDQIVGQALSKPVGELLGSDHELARKLGSGGTLTDEEKAVVRAAAEKARGGEKPEALFMAGGTASGKSSALEQTPELVPNAAVHIDPDEFKTQLPEYSAMRDEGERYAANAAHEESADLAVRARDEARELGLNMLIDGTGDSKPGKFAGKLKEAHENGYKVNSLYVTVPTNTAVVRAVRRADETGRFVPVPEIRTQHRNVSANFPEVGKLPFMNDMKVFDTSGPAPKLIAHGGSGRVTADDPEAMSEFLAKAKE
jgi:predicted ABC-type ATPase